MNKPCALLLHSILISGALFCLMPRSQMLQSVHPTHQSATQTQPEVILIGYGRGVPRSRGGGGTR